jgi:hypothetical protein
MTSRTKLNSTSKNDNTAQSLDLTSTPTSLNSHNYFNQDYNERGDNSTSDNDSENEEKVALLQKSIKERLQLRQQRLPPKSSHSGFTKQALDWKNNELNPDRTTHTRAIEDSLEQTQLEFDRLRYGPLGRPQYRIDKPDRGTIPKKEITLMFFLFIVGVVFLYFGVSRWIDGLDEYQPFFGIALLTLLPSVYQIGIFFGAMFDLGGLTYHDIPRGPSWTS